MSPCVQMYSNNCTVCTICICTVQMFIGLQINLFSQPKQPHDIYKSGQTPDTEHQTPKPKLEAFATTQPKNILSYFRLYSY